MRTKVYERTSEFDPEGNIIRNREYGILDSDETFAGDQYSASLDVFNDIINNTTVTTKVFTTGNRFMDTRTEIEVKKDTGKATYIKTYRTTFGKEPKVELILDHEVFDHTDGSGESTAKDYITETISRISRRSSLHGDIHSVFSISESSNMHSLDRLSMYIIITESKIINNKECNTLTINGNSFDFNSYTSTTSEYDDKGNCIHDKGPFMEYLYEYDEDGNNTKTIGTNIKNGEVTTITTAYKNGKPVLCTITSKDENGKESLLSQHEKDYDGNGNLVRDIYRCCSNENMVHEYEYDNAGNRIAHILNGKIIEESGYNINNRVIYHAKIQDGVVTESKMTYDERGNCIGAIMYEIKSDELK